MSLPSVLTYNELDGEEIRRILENRFQQVMDGVPHFQRHLTFPRVKMTLSVKLEIWADQPAPETFNIGNSLTVVYEPDPPPNEVFDAQSVDSTAPIPEGHPPDEIRDMHGLPITGPAKGDRDVGAHMQIVDQVSLEGREVNGMPGLTISRTGDGTIQGQVVSDRGATIAKIDQGPAGLRRGEMNRNAFHFSSGKSGKDKK
jgi:hypothetical protein